MNRAPVSKSAVVIPCKWHWCRLTFSTLDALQQHVKHDHVSPMKPMQKEQIVLLRRMDTMDASLQSSQNTHSHGGPIASFESIESDQTKSPIPVPHTPPPDGLQGSRAQYDSFRTFTQLSLSAGMESVRNPISPSFESMVGFRGSTGLSAVVEDFERTHNHKSFISSQDAVEQQLTQEDGFDGPSTAASHFPSHLVNMNSGRDPIDNELADTELQWPGSDDEVDGSQPLPEGVHDVQKLDSVSISNHSSLVPSNFDKGRRFHSGSIEVFSFSSGRSSAAIAHTPNGSTSHAGSQELPELTQPFVLQTQAPYYSQSVDSSQSQ